MAMTLEFERSLQAINPRVALPYWDFTVGFSSSLSIGA
jgi:hypothetical protein